jgi:DNA-binding response OmpR family regulator
MTAKADAETRERAHQMGAEAFMTKPFVPDEMLEHVEDLLRHTRNPLAMRIEP